MIITKLTAILVSSAWRMCYISSICAYVHCSFLAIVQLSLTLSQHSQDFSFL